MSAPEPAAPTGQGVSAPWAYPERRSGPGHLGTQQTPGRKAGGHRRGQQCTKCHGTACLGEPLFADPAANNGVSMSEGDPGTRDAPRSLRMVRTGSSREQDTPAGGEGYLHRGRGKSPPPRLRGRHSVHDAQSREGPRAGGPQRKNLLHPKAGLSTDQAQTQCRGGADGGDREEVGRVRHRHETQDSGSGSGEWSPGRGAWAPMYGEEEKKAARHAEEGW